MPHQYKPLEVGNLVYRDYQYKGVYRIIQAIEPRIYRAVRIYKADGSVIRNGKPCELYNHEITELNDLIEFHKRSVDLLKRDLQEAEQILKGLEDIKENINASSR